MGSISCWVAVDDASNTLGFEVARQSVEQLFPDASP